MPSPIPRINLTSGPFGDRAALDEAERAKIEAAYGHELSGKQWQEILDATDILTIRQSSISGTAPLKKTVKTLQKLAISARSLRQDILPNHAESENLSLKDIWYAYFRHRTIEPDDYALFELLLDALEIVISLSKFADKCMTDKASQELIKGVSSSTFYWDVWVCTVSIILFNHGLPYAVSKDEHKRKRHAPSPFVSFISEFQKHLPKECRHFTHSLSALAQAIYRARQSGEMDRVIREEQIDAELSRKLGK